MLEHLQDAKTFPDRTVVIGAGFIGGAIVKRLDAQGAAAVGLRRDFDLLAQDAGARLSAFLRPADSVVVVSAKAPVKNVPMLVENVRMAGAVCEALAAVRVRHIVYLSSDAVYADSDAPLTEASSTVPGSLHGHMHAVREAMLATVAGDVPYAVLRPTLGLRRGRSAQRLWPPTGSDALPHPASRSCCSGRAKSGAITSASTISPSSASASLPGAVVGR